MPNMDIFSFLAIWFNNIRKNTFKVQVVNERKDGSEAVVAKLSQILPYLQELRTKEFKVKVDSQAKVDTKALENKLDKLILSIDNIKRADNRTLEGLLKDLISVGSDIKRVEVINHKEPTLPEPVDISPIIKTLQELIREVRDLKLESNLSMKEISGGFAGMTGSRAAQKITDGTKSVSITTTGGKDALDVNIAGGSSAGTEYTEGDTDATITGTAILMEGATNTLLPVQGTVADGLLVNLGSNNDVTVTGSALTALQNIDTDVTTVIGHVDGIESLLTTIDADTSNISTKIDTIAGAVSGTEVQVDVVSLPTLDTELPPAAALGATDANPTAPAVGAFNMLWANAAGSWNRRRSMENATNSTGSGISAAGLIAQFDDTSPTSITENQFGNVRMSSRREVYTQIRDAAGNERGLNVDSNGAIAITNAGITTIAGAVSGTEMQVDVLTMPTTTVQATNLDIRDLASASDSVSVLQATHDNLNLNANLQVANADVSTTNAVPTKGVPSDIDINGSNANHADKYYTNAGAVTDGIIWSPAAGKRWHVLTLYINVSAAATVTLEDDLAGGDVVRWKGELAANSGVVIKYDKEHPFSSGEDAADLIITTSAGNVYVQAVGYEV